MRVAAILIVDDHAPKKCQTIFLLDSASICGRPRSSHGLRLHGNSYLYTM